MSSNDNRFYAVLVAVTMCVGGCIAWGIIVTQATTEAVKMALEKGQNPLYVKCALENSTQCKDMITAMSLSGQFKDPTAPLQQPIPSIKK